MLIKRQQPANRMRGAFIPADQRRRAAPFKMTMWFCGIRSAAGQRLGLGNGVCHQNIVAVMPVRIARQPGRGQRHHDIQRNDIAALMQRLEKTVLAAGTGRAPDDRRCRVIDGTAIGAHALAV